ncbi:MAG: putative glycoside hydrolase [Chloroflexota bacterium]|nr:putative glycoside hydrolase [Chloroflexota bacterium]
MPHRLILGLVFATLLLAPAAPVRAIACDGILLDDGCLYTATGGDTPEPDDGFAVTNADGVPLWTFVRDRDLQAIGYPISQRWVDGPFTLQAFQKVILQWSPGDGRMNYYNTLDVLANRYPEVRLANVPEHQVQDTAGLSFSRVKDVHLSILDRNPKIKAAFLAEADWLNLFGLPIRYEEREVNGNPQGLQLLRAQRIVFEVWNVPAPGTTQGAVGRQNIPDKVKRLANVIIPEAAKSPVVHVDASDICEIARDGTVERIVSREFPSVFGVWNHVLLNLPIPEEESALEYVERIRAYHDLFGQGMGHGLKWSSTPNGMRVVGAWDFAEKQKNRILAENPSYLHIVPIYHYGAHPELYPEDWPYWLRDESGNRVADEGWGELLIDYTHPVAQDHFVQQAIAIAKCGIFDGIFMDWWTQEEDSNAEIAHLYHGNRINAEVTMLRRIREAVGDDYLIVVNSRIKKIPLSAPYVNGAFMEGHRRHTREYLIEVETTLLWNEENFRYPQVNNLEAWSILTEPLSSADNQRWMRVFTTLNLTHSNGYVSYVIGSDPAFVHQHGDDIWEGHLAEHAAGNVHEHWQQKSWQSFWDAPLGQVLGGNGTKGKLYRGREGLFIREFTSGWAVYNRSGSAQQIELPEESTGVYSGVTGTQHTLADLDGEIYIKGDRTGR